jgi:NAD(P)-dependent dehydrogenase (short-subunit alcohol dehydrogenase family)
MAIKTHPTILMTGAAGGLGLAMRERLKANCDVLRLSAAAGRIAASSLSNDPDAGLTPVSGGRARHRRGV